MKSRLILALMGMAALAFVSFTLQAQDQAKKAPSPVEKDDLITDEQQLARQFADFQDKLLRLKQKLARGSFEEKKKAEIIEKVLEECKNLAINQEFTKMLEILRTAKLANTGNLADLKDQSDVLAQRLRKILDMLQNSDTDRLSQQRKDLEQLIKDLQKAIDRQKTVQAQTDQGKTDTKELGKNQDKVTQDTKKVEKGIEKYLNKDKESKGGEAANPKGENKEGKGEAKAGAKGKEQAKAGKDGDPKAGSKPGDKGKEGSPQASAKDNKGPKGQEGAAKEDKDGGKKAEEGSAKNDGKKAGDKNNPKEAKQGSAKAGDDKKPAGAAGAKESSPSGEAKAGGKPGESGPQASAKAPPMGAPDTGDSKSGEAKSGQSKSAGGQQGEAKPGNQAQGQAQAKDGGNAALSNDDPSTVHAI